MENNAEFDETKPLAIGRRCLWAHHAGASKCEKCVKSCPKGAVSIVDARPVVDIALCSGCGACEAACPVDALQIPRPSASEISQAIGKAAAESEAVIIRCAHSEREGGAVTLPCLARLSPWMILEAVSRGASAITLRKGRCGRCLGIDEARVADAAKVAAATARAAGAAVKFSLEEKPEAINTARRMLFSRFAEKAAASEVPGERVKEIARKAASEAWRRVPASHRSLEESIARLHAKKQQKTALPPLFRLPAIEGEKCAGCSLCAASCPTGALSLDKDGDDLVFSLRHSDCVSCGLCEMVCIWKAVTFKPAPAINSMLDGEKHLLLRKPANHELFESSFENSVKKFFPGVPVHRT